MLAIQIQSMKNFMHHLLNADTFDIFLLEEAIITTANTYTIDGHINREFFTSQELEDPSLCPYDFTPWSECKGLCYNLIRGKRTPLSFKFVLHLKPEKTATLLRQANSSVEAGQVKALVLTIKFDGQKAVVTTGSSYYTFLMTKEPDLIWDKSFTKYLAQKEIGYEEL